MDIIRLDIHICVLVDMRKTLTHGSKKDGVTKAITQLNIHDKEEIVILICVRDVFFDCKFAIDQFVEGLYEV